MFVRKKKNKSGTISVQIIDKSSGSYRVVKTIGAGHNEQDVATMWRTAHDLIPELTGQTFLPFMAEDDSTILNFLSKATTINIRVFGPELVLGNLFDSIGFNAIPDELFRYLVISRLVYPGSKLKMIDYLQRYQGIEVQIDQVYRFLDKLNKRYKTEVEQISYEYTCRTLGDKPGIVFYDVTTLYFESSDEDDYRRTGFSKDGKHSNPQIVLGCLVGYGGYPIGYEIFEGGMYEGYTLEPVLNNFEQRFSLNKPIVVADAGLLSDDNVKMLESKEYKYILGARIKNESKNIKQTILGLNLGNGEWSEIVKPHGRRLIITYSTNRAKKDKYNRERGLKRLEKRLESGKLTAKQLNNRGYNKYLVILGDVRIEIDYDKFNADHQWDGLKGYLTNADLPADQIIDNYKNLWHIEKAFRISKTDLRIRPIYHRLIDRIEAHLCISFSAYAIYKELERALKQNNIPFSAKRAIELTQTMYQMDFVLPASKQSKSVMIGLSPEQQLLYNLFS